MLQKILLVALLFTFQSAYASCDLLDTSGSFTSCVDDGKHAPNAMPKAEPIENDGKLTSSKPVITIEVENSKVLGNELVEALKE